jgi:hypothetical protein
VVGPLPTQPVVHLDAGYDWQPSRQVLAERGMVGESATRGKPTLTSAAFWGDGEAGYPGT